MKGAKAIFGILVIFLVTIHHADSHVEDGKKCNKMERYPNGKIKQKFFKKISFHKKLYSINKSFLFHSNKPKL